MPGFRREHGFLGFAFIILTISTVAWTLADHTPPSWDPADHLRTAYDLYQPLVRGEITGFLLEFFQTPHPYAPLYHSITAVAFLIFGASRLSGIIANFLALAVLLISVNWIGERLYPESSERGATIRPGVVAAILAVCYHFPAWLIHDAFLDYLLTAMVALAFAMLLRADEFHVRADAAVFGVVAGLGMLTKQTFPFFFILPAAFLWYRALIRRDRRAIANLLLSAAIIALIASIWYIPHLNDVIGIYQVNALNAGMEHEKPLFSAVSLAYYWGALCDVQIQLPLSLLFIAGAAYSIRRRFRQDWMLYLWILSGILTFTCVANKDIRYTVPALPAVALLSVSWLDRVRRNSRPLLSAALVLWAFVSFLNAQWPSQSRDLRVSVREIPLYFLAGNVFRFDHPPMAEDWSVPEIVRATAGHKLGVVPNLWQLNPSNIALYARFLAPGRGSPPLVDVHWLAGDATPDRLDYCDYVLVLKESAIALSEHFRPVAVFRLPDSQHAVLYKRLQL